MKTKVLVIDDNMASAQTLKWVMEAVGCEVCLATNGVTALDSVREFIPDVVLSDLNMPKIDGYEMCKIMKQDARLANTLFIAQTGLSSSLAQKLSSEAGFKYHLVKPIDINLLLELVTLSGATAHHQLAADSS